MGIRPHDADSPALLAAPEPQNSKVSFRLGVWQRLRHLFPRDHPVQPRIQCEEPDLWPTTTTATATVNPTVPPPSSVAPRDGSASGSGVGVLQSATFERRHSERRDRLFPIEPCVAERRAVSASRHSSVSLPIRPRSTSSPPQYDPGRGPVPAVAATGEADATDPHVDTLPWVPEPVLPSNDQGTVEPGEDDRPPRPLSTTSSDVSHDERRPVADDKAQLNAELDSRWILNLSMHFRDKSDREKFFVTYAETPTKWRRVTISCDYRNAEPGSLEMDLKELQFQRDKSLQIYESIRDSLPEIQFYDTVTNLKLETTDGRLHVHVTEDINEIIPYPLVSTVEHILNDETFHPQRIRESDLSFDSHLSGFVYKVRHEGKIYVKKEIPGPDTVDEFLYEMNALHALHDSRYVIQLEAIVLDDSSQLVKGLLISYAERGAVVDLLYDHRGAIPWEDRCRWAEHAVRGLSDVHEEGYVQGDFTLSNIVVDADGDAKIIDINRRGCPVGWEPPEIVSKIASNQRISMYIGEKSDLYQLGMTLWALAMDDDEPERHDPPLGVDAFPSEIPEWYQDVVRLCLSPRPRDRLSAKELVTMFPPQNATSSARPLQTRPSLASRAQKQYIDPANAVERDDIERLSITHREAGMAPYSPQSSRGDYTFTYPRSSNYDYESASSAFERPRGRRPPSNSAHLGRGERRHWLPERDPSLTDDDLEPQILAIFPGQEPEYDEVELDGHPYLVHHLNEEELRILGHQSPEDHSEHPREVTGESIEIDMPPPLPEPADYVPQRRPSLLMGTSATSGSTPRNSHSMLPSWAPNNASTLAANWPSSSADLRGFGSHPDLVDERPDEPGVGGRRPVFRPSPSPPSLPYADSGYDEPFGSLEHDIPFANGLLKVGKPHEVDTASMVPVSLDEPRPSIQPPSPQNDAISDGNQELESLGLLVPAQPEKDLEPTAVTPATMTSGDSAQDTALPSERVDLDASTAPSLVDQQPS